MAEEGPGQVTQLLHAWHDGNRAALDRLIPLVQEELRKIAAAYLARERPEHTLQPTALVNEAYVRMVDQQWVNWESRAHFFGISARMMRQILVDHARKQRAAKRGGLATRLVFDEAFDRAQEDPNEDSIDVLDLHHALEKLAVLDPRQEKIVELKFFSGLTIEETAAVLDLSPATIKREWTTARAWLYHELTR